ncbi:uncharacterized protein [Diadema antillarum]|uniref:uncharacterized protein n=1 Tax=Diadema antillarum TaxID=105358 RepID=UPI003A8A7266
MKNDGESTMRIPTRHMQLFYLAPVFCLGFIGGFLLAWDFQYGNIEGRSWRSVPLPSQPDEPKSILQTLQLVLDQHTPPAAACRETQSETSSVETPQGRRVILTTSNYGFVNMTKNWLKSLRNSGVQERVVIIAEDKASHSELRAIRRPNLTVEYTELGRSQRKVMTWGEQSYRDFVSKRAIYILRLLRRGVDVLFSDADVVWLKDPLPVFTPPEYDVYYSKANQMLACVGFAYYAATEQTIKLMEEWIIRMRSNPTMQTQVILNRIITSKYIPSLKVGILDQSAFTNVKGYKNSSAGTEREDIYMVHVNSVTGSSEKTDILKSINLWYLE